MHVGPAVFTDSRCYKKLDLRISPVAQNMIDGGYWGEGEGEEQPATIACLHDNS